MTSNENPEKSAKAKPKRVRKSKSSKSSTVELKKETCSDSPQPAEISPVLELVNQGMALKQLLSGGNIGDSEISTENPVLSVLKDMVEGMRSGGGIEDLQRPLVQLTANQEDRAKLVKSLILTNDYTRLANYLIIRDKFETILTKQAAEGQLSPNQCLDFLRIVRNEIDTIQSSVVEGASGGVDVTVLLNKVNHAAKANRDQLSQKIKGSPQNRELVRKIIYQLSKVANGKRPHK